MSARLEGPQVGYRLDGHGDDPVGPLVDYVAVRVVPPADAQSTLAAFTRSAWDWLCRSMEVPGQGM